MQKNSVQFCGLPGSGKTTAIRELVKNFPENYLTPPKFKKLKRFTFATLFIFCFPWLSLNFILLVFKNPIKLWSYLFHLLSVSFAVHFYVSIKKTNKIFLIDEGVYQRMLSVAYKKFSSKEIQKCIKMVSKIYSPVVITHGGNFSRFVLEPDRMISHRNSLGEKYYKNWSDNLIHNFNLLVEEVKKSERYCFVSSIKETHKNIQNLV